MSERHPRLKFVENGNGESFVTDGAGTPMYLDAREADAWNAMSSGVPDSAAADILVRIYGLDASAAAGIVSALREKLRTAFPTTFS